LFPEHRTQLLLLVAVLGHLQLLLLVIMGVILQLVHLLLLRLQVVVVEVLGAQVLIMAGLVAVQMVIKAHQAALVIRLLYRQAKEIMVELVARGLPNLLAVVAVQVQLVVLV
jgi:hypothetical protein